MKMYGDVWLLMAILKNTPKKCNTLSVKNSSDLIFIGQYSRHFGNMSSLLNYEFLTDKVYIFFNLATFGFFNIRSSYTLSVKNSSVLIFVG